MLNAISKRLSLGYTYVIHLDYGDTSTLLVLASATWNSKTDSSLLS